MTESERKKVQRLLKLFNGDNEICVEGARAEEVRASEAIGEGENQVVYLEWRENSETFNLKITEAGLAGAQSRETVMELKDCDGEPVTLEFHGLSAIVPIAALVPDQIAISEEVPEAAGANHQNLENSNRAVLLTAEQARKIIDALKTVPDRLKAHASIILMEELLADIEERRAYVAAAREKHASDEGDVEVDEGAAVSIGNDGAYVQAWTWVPKER